MRKKSFPPAPAINDPSWLVVRSLQNPPTASYRIESGMHLPPPPTRMSHFPLDKMKRGDSFVLKIAEVSGARNAAQRLGLAIVTRKIGDGQSRLWLVGKVKPKSAAA